MLGSKRTDLPVFSHPFIITAAVTVTVAVAVAVAVAVVVVVVGGGGGVVEC